ncbi:MAG TPA: TIGR00730 family Rossman fold protein [Anaerolineaceae bacterium]|nr:TIGR00730 family Rossman fold protein [Anaerolineaceae bacterium]
MTNNPPTLKRICVFCGSSPGANSEYLEVARQLGETLARRNLTLVYGGAKVGLMGQVARAALAAGGQVIGVIPRSLLDMEVAYTDVGTLHVVGSMHERKSMMADLSDSFIALPGGLGTIEEFFEVLTWAQLGFHQKPCGLLNIGGYYDHLLKFLDVAVREEFIDQAHREMVLVDTTAAGLLDQFARYAPPKSSKAAWVLEKTSHIQPTPTG